VASPRAVLLDALGTIVALEPPAPALRAELRERFGIELSEADAQGAIAAEMAYYRSHLDEGRDAASLAALRQRCAEALRAAVPGRERLGAVDPRALTDALLASLRFSAFADVQPALAAARREGRRVVVVSNWDISLHGVLERLDVAPMLDGIVTSAEAGVRKPGRGIFDEALRLADTPASATVHVGDSLEEDVMGARQAGIEPVLLRRDGQPGPSGVQTITSLAELA
jgi:putative hydrolase of the HAD superfamily